MTEWTLARGDCLGPTGLPSLADGCAGLVFADPPFNVGYAYDVYKDTLCEAEYLRWCREWIDECRRILRPGGALWVAIGDEYAAEIAVLLRSAGLCRRNWVVWHYTFGPNQKSKFSRCKAHLLYFVKPGEKPVFEWEAVAIESARQRLGDRRASPTGKTPSDVWNFSRVCGTFKERTQHPCQMPVAVLDRIVRACTREGDLVADPFAGSGTAGVAAVGGKRRYWGCELSDAYADIAASRLEEAATCKAN